MAKPRSIAGFRRILLAAMGTGAVASSCGGDSTDDTPKTDEAFTCEQPEPWPPGVFMSGGYVQCESGVVHRPAPETCSTPATPDGVTAPYPELEPCATDADCTEMPNGFCRVTVRSVPAPTTSVCVYPCTGDGDCALGFACFCDAGGGRCIPASCSSDSDCGDEPCILLFTDIQCGAPVNPELFCQTNEGCSADAECSPGTACISGTCTSLFNSCGRPFLVRGTERRAKAKARGDWCKTQAFDAAAHLEPALRSILSKHFTEIALMEHASIAAFARFTLELLSLGAPAELVARAARAMVNETDHARACFALAARYRGAEVGPGPLSARGCLDHADPVSIFSTAFREACVGKRSPRWPLSKPPAEPEIRWSARPSRASRKTKRATRSSGGASPPGCSKRARRLFEQRFHTSSETFSRPSEPEQVEATPRSAPTPAKSCFPSTGSCPTPSSRPFAPAPSLRSSPRASINCSGECTTSSTRVQPFRLIPSPSADNPSEIRGDRRRRAPG